MQRIGEHAVVLGASVAGLLTARVLAEAYEQVTLVDRDEFPPAPDGTGQPRKDVPQGRKGVPQGRHAHVLLPRGEVILEDLFPGLVDELLAGGAVAADPSVDHRFIMGGHLLRRAADAERALQASRPFLEQAIRGRVAGLPAVRFAGGCDAVGLVAPDPARVTGVRLMRRTVGSAVEETAADLVVDAMGRASRTPVWLESLGYQPAPREEVQIEVTYASQYVRLPPERDGIEKAVVVGPRPGRSRAMVVLALEGGRRLLTVAGVQGNRPPTDAAGFLDFAARLAPPDVAAAIRAAEPLSEIVPYRYSRDRRHRYERWRRFPAGLLVTGDALSSFSPIYAQGMTVAALEAMALRHSLARGEEGLSRRFFRAAAKAIDDPWRIAVAADLNLPEVPGRRSPMVRLLNAYMDKVQAAGARDASIGEQFMRVVGLLDPPSRLLRPQVVARVLAGARPGAGRKPAPATAREPAT